MTYKLCQAVVWTLKGAHVEKMVMDKKYFKGLVALLKKT